MALSSAHLKQVERQGYVAYRYGHPRDYDGYKSELERDAYQAGWDRGQKEKPGVPLQQRYK